MSAEGAMLDQIAESYGGSFPCSSCGQVIFAPTPEEGAALLSGAVVTAPLPPEERPTEIHPAPDGGAAPARKPPPVASAKPAAMSAMLSSPPAMDEGEGPVVVQPGAGNPADIQLGFGGRKLVTLEQEQRGERLLAIKTIRHADCMKDGRDEFDDVVTGFLRSQGEPNILRVSTIQYRADEKGALDYGVVILYKAEGPLK